jgi:hypothetical protein
MTERGLLTYFLTTYLSTYLLLTHHYLLLTHPPNLPLPTHITAKHGHSFTHPIYGEY